MISYKVNDKIKNAPLESIRLGGAVGAVTDDFLYKRVLSDFAKNEIFEEALRAFAERRDDENAVGFWRGEFWGKLAISAVRTYRYTGDESLKGFLIDNAYRLLSLQDGDGYLNSYRDPDNILAADPKDTRAIMGWDCNWNWNVWCRKYTLWGLLEIYEMSHDAKILEGAVRLSDHLIDQLRRMGLRLCDVGTFNGLASCSIIKPMLMLYRYTENEKYLNFCIEEAASWEREDGHAPNIITNALADKPIHTWYPDPNSWAKAYEMLSCLDGLCELYRLTGEKKYFLTCEKMYELICEHELNVLFSVGYNDQFSHGAAHENSLTEACDVIHWMRLCSELYRLTGDVKYMGDIERAFYNPFLGASFSDGTWAARTVRSAGRNEKATQMDMKYSHCCTNNMPRGYLNAAEGFVTYSEDTLYINMYTEFEGSVKLSSGKADVRISGSYLSDGNVKIAITAEKPLKLMLRVPEYSTHTDICIDGDPTSAEAGYFEAELAEGEHRAEIKFLWTPEIRDFSGAVEDFPDTDFRMKRFIESKFKFDREHMIWNRRSTLVYGPLLLTRSRKCGSTRDEMFGSDFTVCGKGYSCTLTPAAKIPENVRVCFNAHFENGKHSFDTTVCDFASGCNDYVGDDMELFSIWF